MSYEVGAELDRLIAEQALGLEFIAGNGALMSADKFVDENGDFYCFAHEWHPSLDINDAFTVVVHVGRPCRLFWSERSGNWCANFHDQPMNDVSATLPHAICLAALSAIAAKKATTPHPSRQ